MGRAFKLLGMRRLCLGDAQRGPLAECRDRELCDKQLADAFS